MVDERDFQLLARLLREPLAGHEALGRAIGVSGTAAKARLERLAAEGVFNGFRGIPAPEVFGRQRRVFVFRKTGAGPEVVQEAIRVDPVVSSHLRQDGLVSTIAYPVDDDGGPPDELVRAFGEPVFTVRPRPVRPPPAPVVLSPIDWRVMRPLVREPRMPVRTLADRVRLSPKTVRRHRDAMIRDGTLMIETSLSGARAQGLLLHNMYLVLPRLPPTERHQILTKLPRCVAVSVMAEPPSIYVFCRASTFAEVLHDEATAKEIAGPEQAGLVFPIATAYAAERIEAWVDEETARWDRRRTT